MAPVRPQNLEKVPEPPVVGPGIPSGEIAAPADGYCADPGADPDGADPTAQGLPMQQKLMVSGLVRAETNAWETR